MDVMRTLARAAIATLAITACGKKKDAPTAGSGSSPGTGTAVTAGSTTGPGGGSGTAPPAEPPLPAVAKPDEAAVRKLVDAWLAAQNGGDFAAYQALYAEKMEGVKRVGLHATRFDRKGWLADRARMFRFPMVVSVRDVAIGGTATTPTVELVQAFKQGRFSDEGPKRMVLTRGPAGLAIAREEMVASTVGGPQALANDPVALLVVVDKQPRVVITASADDAWATGAISGPLDGDHMFAMRNATKAPQAAGWTGRSLQVFTADGKACPATVGALHLLGGGTPHFGEVQAWDGDPDAGDGHTWSPAERAAALYGMGDLYLVGDLTITGDCKPAFAMAADAKPTVFQPGPATPAIAAAAVAAFRKLPRYAELQGQFHDAGRDGPWVPDPTVIAFSAGGKHYVEVRADEGEGCSEFQGQLVALFAEDGGKLTLLTNPKGDYFDIEAVIDSDGDGQIELIGSPEDYSTLTSHLTMTAAGLAPTASVTFPYNDCPC